MKTSICLIPALVVLTAAASHVEETMHLSKGWNAIYLESTPDKAACAEFFAGSPVVSVGCYSSDAYESTAQYNADGTEINQKPVSYSVWFADEERGSTLHSLEGGRCYLIYATNNWRTATPFLGVPAQPRMIWRKAGTNGDGFMNLAGVSCGGGALETTRPAGDADLAETAAADYFGPGPFGVKGVAYQIGGLNEATPSFLPLSFGSRITVKDGMAYALTAERADDWSGVIRIGGIAPFGAVDFGTADRRSSFTVANASAIDRTFTLVCRPSADAREQPLNLLRLVRDNPYDAGEWMPIRHAAPWTLDLRAGESVTVQLALDRVGMTTNASYGSVLEVRDESGSKMRVRIPLTASVDPEEDRTTGLWVGAVQLTHVSQWTNETPVVAGGAMKTTLLLHIDTNGVETLLPQAVVSTEADGATGNDVVRLRLDLEDVPADSRDSARRITGGIVPKPVTDALPQERSSQFDWTVAPDDRVNPFRHAWHPDHGEGVAIDNSLRLVRMADWTGENVPPAYTNALPRIAVGEMSDGMDADGVVSGCVIWEMSLNPTKKVVALGRFALRRFVSVGEIEK